VSRDFIWCLAKMPSPLMHSLSATITCTGPITGAKPLICRLDVDLAGVCLWVFFHGGNSCGVRYQSGLLFFFLLLLVFLFYFLFVFDLWMNVSSTSYFIDPQFNIITCRLGLGRVGFSREKYAPMQLILQNFFYLFRSMNLLLLFRVGWKHAPLNQISTWNVLLWIAASLFRVHLMTELPRRRSLGILKGLLNVSRKWSPYLHLCLSACRLWPTK